MHSTTLVNKKVMLGEQKGAYMTYELTAYLCVPTDLFLGRVFGYLVLQQVGYFKY